MEIENFCKLTGYNVSPAEFVHIKESFEDSGISNSTDFCAQWLIDKANGFWKKELKLREKLASVRQELADITADKVLVEQHESEKDEHIAHLEAEITKLTAVTNKATDTIQALLDTKNKLTDELESAKADTAKATEAVDELNAFVTDQEAEKAELNRKLDAVITAADEQTVEFNKLKAEYETLKQQTEDGVATTDIDELKHELAVTKTELDTVKAELIEQQYSVEDYKSLLFSINKMSKI